MRRLTRSTREKCHLQRERGCRFGVTIFKAMGEVALELESDRVVEG